MKPKPGELRHHAELAAALRHPPSAGGWLGAVWCLKGGCVVPHRGLQVPGALGAVTALPVHRGVTTAPAGTLHGPV